MFDQFVASVSGNDLLKGGVVMAFVWYGWFRTDDGRGGESRGHVIATILGCIAALALGRLMVAALPFRIRPLHDRAIDFLVPYGVNDSVLAKASSFPSDHAVLFFGLATGLFFVSRRLGWAALLYTTVVVALPRMYLGLHYFSDVVAGALIGASVCWLANIYLPRLAAVQAVQRVASNRPMYFYPMLFLLTYQIAELFDSTRAIAGGLVRLIR